jgi:hypothetical protein
MAAATTAAVSAPAKTAVTGRSVTLKNISMSA